MLVQAFSASPTRPRPGEEGAVGIDSPAAESDFMVGGMLHVDSGRCTAGVPRSGSDMAFFHEVFSKPEFLSSYG